jgi:hypothetical protein
VDNGRSRYLAYTCFLNFVDGVGEAPLSEALIAVNQHMAECKQWPVRSCGELLATIQDQKRTEMINKGRFWET